MKILATIGPETENEKAIAFISGYTNYLRLNGSHSDYGWHNSTVKRIRRVNPGAVILLDIPGIKPRTGNLVDIDICQGEEVTFFCSGAPVTKGVPLTRQLPAITRAPETFSLNDGQHVFATTSVSDMEITGTSLSNFTLNKRKGLNIPGAIYDDEKQKDVVSGFLDEFGDIDADAYGLSFVQNASVVRDIKARFPGKIIISKLENTEGIRNLEEICEISDAIMIDRGDLAAEVGLENLFNRVNRVSACCRRYGKPLIMATENLTTMMSANRPSKSDIMSLGHSINIGADCIMLSEESAMSVEYRNIITWLHDFLSVFELEPIETVDNDIDKEETMWSIVSTLSKDLPFVVASRSGNAFFKVMARNFEDIHLISDNPKLLKLAQFYRKAVTIEYDEELSEKVPATLIYDYVKKNLDTIFKDKQVVLSTFVSKPFHGALADNITFIDREKVSR